MKINDQDWSLLSFIRAFFPLNLLFAHLKYNFSALIVWLIFFLAIFNKAGSPFGIYQLFLSPEYLGEVSNFSFLLTGFAFGGFIMGFNTYSYVKLGARYPFLTTIAKPFLKFCLNNALIPATFILCYLIVMMRFQMREEMTDWLTSGIYALSFLSGLFFFLILSFLFFFPLGKSLEDDSETLSKPIQSTFIKKERWYDLFRSQRDRQYIYMGKRFKLMVSRSAKHFDKKLVEKIYARNRINASLFELLTIGSYLILGFFADYKWFEFPAATSIVLLFTIGIMVFSALQSWLQGWVYPILIFLLIFMDILSVKTGMFNYTSYAFGLNYAVKDEYTVKRMQAITRDKKLHSKGRQNEIQILNNWKEKNQNEKPKLIIINTSGGGSRSALWTMLVLQKCNQHIGQVFLDRTHLITGASGGMVGAAYFRELQSLAAQEKIKSPNRYVYREAIGKDMLNKLSFMASTNDMFIRYQRFEYNKMRYTKERGYAFEEQLHQNTNDVMDHPLSYYRKLEEESIIPTMIFSPTIINDGRRLLIASRSLDFLASKDTNKYIPAMENLDIYRLLSKQKVGQMRFSSVMRASATFPFVMPMMTLPTKPEIQLMDAGIRDNYGGTTTLLYLSTMSDWIQENTSGVIILQIRDIKKTLDDEKYKQVSFISKLTLPFGNMYKNFPKVQDYNQEQMIELATKNRNFPVHFVSFNLIEKEQDKISLSWHLTSNEKKKIGAAYYSTDNQKSLRKLKKLLSE